MCSCVTHVWKISHLGLFRKSVSLSSRHNNSLSEKGEKSTSVLTENWLQLYQDTIQIFLTVRLCHYRYSNCSNLLAALRWSTDVLLTPSFFSVSSQGGVEKPHMDWTAEKKRTKPGEGRPMLKWTSYAKNEKNNRRKKTHCFDFILCSHNKVRVRKAPHLTCHVLCTSLWPNNLPSVVLH